MPDKQITTRDMYDLVDRKMSEIRGEVKDLRTENGEKFKTISNRLNNLDNRYVTRREQGVFKWLTGVSISVMGIVLALLELFRR